MIGPLASAIEQLRDLFSLGISGTFVWKPCRTFWISKLWQSVTQSCRLRLSKKYTYLVSFSHFRSFSVCKSASVSDFGLVQIISRLESQSSRCLHYFAALYRRTKEVAPGSAIFRGIFRRISQLKDNTH